MLSGEGAGRPELFEQFKSLPLDLSVRWLDGSQADGRDGRGISHPEPLLGSRIFDACIDLPVAVIRERRLDHNIRLLQEYCLGNGVLLAPHAKTTMAPEIWSRQLRAGAWGLTAANVSQAKVMRWFGVSRILIANEVVDPRAIAWLGSAQEPGVGVEVVCLVDSVDGVERMERTLRASGAKERTSVLIEIGRVDGRAGCRSVEEAFAVARAVRQSETLWLAGVECYEGLIEGLNPSDRLLAVDEYLYGVAEAIRTLLKAGVFDHLDEMIVSGGGSSYFDRVVDLLNPRQFDIPAQLVLRSGCYVVHDCTLYERSSPLGAVRGDHLPERLQAALEVWGSVLSRPEPNLAIFGAGKRDLSADYLLPEPIAYAVGGQVEAVPPEWNVYRLMDHHAFIDLGSSSIRPDIGQWVGLGINHPCATFDRWPAIALVDEDYVVKDIIRTIF
jgi:D-serine deaminase-like pyridoxal phosphate-dependent protein